MGLVEDDPAELRLAVVKSAAMLLASALLVVAGAGRLGDTRQEFRFPCSDIFGCHVEVIERPSESAIIGRFVLAVGIFLAGAGFIMLWTYWTELARQNGRPRLGDLSL